MQSSRETEAGSQLMRDTTKVMLAIVTNDDKVATINFTALGDGTLSQINETPTTSILRSNIREVLLPLNTLDKIKTIGIAAPPPEGTITALNRVISDGIPNVQVTSAEASILKNGQEITIQGTSAYDGHYHITKIDDTTFEIDAPWVENSSDIELGIWQVVPPEEQAIVFDGIITGYEITSTGKLRIKAENHGLENGDEVQIFDTASYDGSYPITKVDDQNFAINNLRWQTGEAVNLKLQSLKRRGIVLNGVNDYVELPPQSMPIGNEITVSFWAKRGEKLPKETAIIYANGANNERVLNIHLPYSNSSIYFDCGADGNGYDRIEKAAQPNEYQGEWVHWAFTKNATTGDMKIYHNGKLWHSGTGYKRSLPKTAILHLGKFTNANVAYYDGTVAELCIWKVARTAEEIKNSMYLRLTGQELDLVGYWRLGGIAVNEDNQRQVIDFSVNKNDGIVYGDCYVSAVTLNRKLGDAVTNAVQYRNPELFAVTQQASYEETFEFKVTPAIDPNNVNGTKLFNCTYWGQKSHRSGNKLSFPGNVTEIKLASESGWYIASCSFTVPDEVNLIRCFEISNITGTWNNLEVRKHRIRKVSDVITQASYTDNVNLTNLVDNQTTLTAKLKELQLKENHEGALFKEKRELQAKIAAYNAQAETRAKIETLNAQVATLTTEESNLLAKYNTEKDSPFNYYSVLSFKAGGDNQRVQGILRSYFGLELVAQPIGDWQKVKFTSTGDGYYVLSLKSMGEIAVVQVVLRSYYGLELASYSVNNDNQKVKFTSTGDGYYVMSFQGRGDNQRVQVIGRSYMGLEVVGQAINDYQKVKLISTGEQTNENITIAYENWQAKLKQLNQAKEELNRLNLALTATATDKDAWDAFLAQVIQEITTIKTQLNTLNTDFLNGVKSTQQTLPTMPEIASQGDLVTTGAILDFIDSASRVTVLETCEGMVQLSYFDQQGKLRQGVFDATADEVNSYFEQWLPDRPPVCLNCNSGNQRIDLSGNGIFLSDNWTIEANFVYPLADTNQWNTLTAQSSGDGLRPTGGDRQIVIKDGKYVCTDVNKTFYYCLINSTLTNDAANGYDLSQLSPGWHHLAVVGTTVTDGQTVTSKTIFYLDAKKVGECNVKSNSVIQNIGNIQVGGEAFGKISEVRLWNIALKDTEILANSQVYLTGNEPGLVSYHRLDEGSGNEARDYTGNGNNGTIVGANWWGNTKVLAAPIAQVMNFDGNGDYITIPSSLLNNRSAFTMEGWIKPASFVGTTSLFGQNDLVKFGLISQELAIWTNNSNLLKTAYPYSANEWHHVAVVGDGQKVSLYIDGVKKVEGGSTTTNYGTSTYPVTIGAGVWNGGEKEPFTGQMADIRVWSVARTAAEIQANISNRLKGKEKGLELYLPLNRTYLEGTTTKVFDLAKNNHGKVSGASLTTATPRVVKQSVSTLVPAPTVVFNGTNNYINLGNPTAIAFPGTASYTIEAWINPDATGVNMSIISKWNGGINGSFNFLVDGQKKLGINHNVPPWIIYSSGTLQTGKFNHVAVTYSGSLISFYINGQPAGTGNISVGGSADKTTNVLIGANYNQNSPNTAFFKGKIAEVRIWNKARTQVEIQSTMNKRLIGTEANLVGYWRLDSMTGTTVTGLVGGINGTVTGGAALTTTNDLSFPVMSNVLSLDSLPLNQGKSITSTDVLITSVEYGTYDIDPISKQKSAMMRRMFAYPTHNGVEVLTDKRIENLELIWIGNAQFKPTLLGYIEGAPPVPSENLNIDGDYQYNGATSVELTTSEDVEYSWNRSQDAGLGASADIFLGVDSQTFGGIGVATQIESTKTGIKGTLDMSYQCLNESNITSSSSLVTTDRLDLRGAPEVTAKFSHYGRRFMPKNVGYALVVSGLADVFITRLSRSQKMVGYEVRPVEDIPPDVNTITFLMNPAYVMNGSLDGLVGSSAANDEFYAHVPEMRSQYGSLYPASYFRLMEAYNLKQQIEKADKERKSYFDNFNSNLVDQTSLNRQAGAGTPLQSVGLSEGAETIDTTGQELTDEQKQAQVTQIKEEGGAKLADLQKQGQQRKQEISSRIDDIKQRTHALESFAGWQKTMENILVRSGKRNIVNTYVWDADGGLRVEEQSFANTAEHTIGGSFTLSGGLGYEGDISIFKASGGLTALATTNMTQTMTKTQASSKGMELKVDLSGIENLGITDENDIPFQPGEKVDRFRMMSFYLENSTDNYLDFFRYVVDPEWLATNDEEARALRQVQSGRPNKTWRVLHRVTYVERPALMGFGRDMRSLAEIASYSQARMSWLIPANATVLDEVKIVRDRVEYLEQENAKLQAKLDKIIDWMNNQS
ncbi:LamG domain-containing protein [Anabaena sp. UHCC 0399]|uniref:LamG domain-containing protein n=1 Tax=Anabaena sp. UHCC 0399 TaxID=3110238 RepID=UPI002B2203C1|nr:LamG domain-containing protein [Anabaena sp. UHCC 0399]MEA5564202.1 LamG domain-containing protein [Anabaena sp. UHCC 0399]